jgi:hypothetical protein
MRQPIGFSRFEIKNFFETETLEPRRGPGSQVSLVVIAMNNCGAFLIQARDALFVELRQRDVDRSGQMGAGKLLGRQNFNEVRPVIDSLSQLIAAYDDLRHWLSSFQISSRTLSFLELKMQPTRMFARRKRLVGAGFKPAPTSILFLWKADPHH